MNFDMVYMPGISRNMVNRFNIFDTPYHFLEINRLANAYRSGTEKIYFETYPLDVSPQTDNRPFPYRFLKWTRLKALYKMTGSRFYSLFMSGELVVTVVFLEAFGISSSSFNAFLLYNPSKYPKILLLPQFSIFFQWAPALCLWNSFLSKNTYLFSVIR